MPTTGKGAEFERDICKKLSLWWTEGERDDVFWRTSGSGSRATTRGKLSIDTAYSHGDVTFIDPIGKPFIDACLIELKRGYTDSISILDLLDRPSGKMRLVEWWDKAHEEKVFSGRKWTIIIFKRNRREPCVLMCWEMFKQLRDLYGDLEHIRIRAKVDLCVIKLSRFLHIHQTFFTIEGI